MDWWHYTNIVGIILNTVAFGYCLFKNQTASSKQYLDWASQSVVFLLGFCLSELTYSLVQRFS